MGRKSAWSNLKCILNDLSKTQRGNLRNSLINKASVLGKIFDQFRLKKNALKLQQKFSVAFSDHLLWSMYQKSTLDICPISVRF